MSDRLIHPKNSIIERAFSQSFLDEQTLGVIFMIKICQYNSKI